MNFQDKEKEALVFKKKKLKVWKCFFCNEIEHFVASQTIWNIDVVLRVGIGCEIPSNPRIPQTR